MTRHYAEDPNLVEYSELLRAFFKENDIFLEEIRDETIAIIHESLAVDAPDVHAAVLDPEVPITARNMGVWPAAPEFLIMTLATHTNQTKTVGDVTYMLTFLDIDGMLRLKQHLEQSIVQLKMCQDEWAAQS